MTKAFNVPRHHRPACSVALYKRNAALDWQPSSPSTTMAKQDTCCNCGRSLCDCESSPPVDHARLNIASSRTFLCYAGGSNIVCLPNTSSITTHMCIALSVSRQLCLSSPLPLLPARSRSVNLFKSRLHVLPKCLASPFSRTLRRKKLQDEHKQKREYERTDPSGIDMHLRKRQITDNTQAS